MPHFRFAPAPSRCFAKRCVRVIGMDLNRELVGGENKFHEQRKIAASRKVIAVPFGRHLLPCLPECLASKWSGSNLTIDSGEPHFANRFLQICLFGKKRCERAHSPNAFYEFRFDAKGLGPHVLYLSRGFRARKKSLQSPQPFLDTLDGSG